MWKAIIIDDEELSRESLTLDIQKHCPNISVIAQCPSAKEGMLTIKSLKPDLIFLDVQMPWMNGIEMLEVMRPFDFKVIFVTAYDQYAIQAFRLSALDYLLKPIDPEELKTAVSKMKEADHNPYRDQIANLLENADRSDLEKRIAIPNSDGLEFIKISDILYCEADGSYCYVHLVDGKKILVAKPLLHAEKLLKPYDFCRIHHSFLINLFHVEKYIRGDGGTVIMQGGVYLPVARNRKGDLMQKIERM